MSHQDRFEIIANPAARQSGDAARLSVLIPFLRDDPTALLSALDAQAAEVGAEIVLIDDGAPEAELTARVAEAVNAASAPARLIVSRRNLGRSGARNALAGEAAAPWLIYLDADMQIGPQFLQLWAQETGSDAFDLAFGGYEPPEQVRPEQRVHAALAHAGDVESAEARRERGAAAFCGSNFAVRAKLMAETPFDEGYVGWGWEDVDWAVRANTAGRLTHIDNPARHGGLQDASTLVAKFRAGGANHARLLLLHPDQRDRPAARLAILIKRLRLIALTRWFGLQLASGSIHPVRLRVLGLKLVRAAACAEHLP
ncbi:MAG: glycosyltransferase [Pseudomonadota bacterium]